MKRVIVAAAILMTLSAHAFAVEDAEFQQAVMRCWNTPVEFEDAGLFVMSVEIDDNGSPVDITAKEHQNDGVSRAFGATLKRAIMRCSPYKFPKGTYSLTFNDKAGGKSLNPFK